MSKQYKVFDPITGSHVAVQTLDEVRVELQQAAQRLLDAQTFSVAEVETDEASNETWVSMDSTGIVNAAPVTQYPTPRPVVADD